MPRTWAPPDPSSGTGFEQRNGSKAVQQRRHLCQCVGFASARWSSGRLAAFKSAADDGSFSQLFDSILSSIWHSALPASLSVHCRALRDAVWISPAAGARGREGARRGVRGCPARSNVEFCTWQLAVAAVLFTAPHINAGPVEAAGRLCQQRSCAVRRSCALCTRSSHSFLSPAPCSSSDSRSMNVPV